MYVIIGIKKGQLPVCISRIDAPTVIHITYSLAEVEAEDCDPIATTYAFFAEAEEGNYETATV